MAEGDLVDLLLDWAGIGIDQNAELGSRLRGEFLTIVGQLARPYTNLPLTERSD